MGIKIDKNCVKFVSNENNIFRFHYVGINVEPFFVRDIAYEKFVCPNGMTKEEALKVLSFLMKVFKTNTKIKDGDLLALTIGVNNMLRLFHFKKLDKTDCSNYTDLFVVGGVRGAFKTSRYYEFYFNWFKDDVDRAEIEQIYSRLGLNIPNFEIKKTDIIV